MQRKITIDIPEISLPCYKKYPFENEAQRAYLSLNCDKSILKIKIESLEKIMDADTFYERTIQWPIPEKISYSSLIKFIQENMHLFQNILDGYSLKLDKTKNNQIGTFSLEAQKAIDIVQTKCHNFCENFDPAIDSENSGECNDYMAEMSMDEIWPSEASFEEAVAYIKKMMEGDGFTPLDDIAHAIHERLLFEMKENGFTPSKNQKSILTLDDYEELSVKKNCGIHP